MPLFTEVQARILAALNAKAPVKGPCTVCGTNNFTIVDGFVSLDVSDDVSKGTPGSRRLPSVALCCSNCGNTLFLNLYRLGLGDLIDQLTPQVTPQESPPRYG